MRGVLWCSGSQPSQSVIDAVLDEGVPVFGVDAGADRAVESGIEVEEVLGDLDSVDLARWDRGLHELPDQSSSDLAKSISLLIERGFAEIDVVGIEGGTPGMSWGVGLPCARPPEGLESACITRMQSPTGSIRKTVVWISKSVRGGSSPSSHCNLVRLGSRVPSGRSRAKRYRSPLGACTTRELVRLSASGPTAF